jgi:hypothetical protein
MVIVVVVSQIMKKKNSKKTKCNNKCKKNNKKCSREKVCGEPTIVKPATLSYVNGQVYPLLDFRPDSLWTRIKRFFGLVP